MTQRRNVWKLLDGAAKDEISKLKPGWSAGILRGPGELQVIVSTDPDGIQFLARGRHLLRDIEKTAKESEARYAVRSLVEELESPESTFRRSAEAIPGVSPELQRVREVAASRRERAREFILRHLDPEGAEAYSRGFADAGLDWMSIPQLNALLNKMEGEGLLSSELRRPPFKDKPRAQMARRYYWKRRASLASPAEEPDP